MSFLQAYILYFRVARLMRHFVASRNVILRDLITAVQSMESFQTVAPIYPRFYFAIIELDDMPT